MAKLENILEVYRNIEESLNKRMTEFKKQLKTTTNETTKTSVDRLATEFKEFKSSVWNVLSLLKSLTTNLAAQIDEVDSQSRRNVLLFGGIDEAKGENLISTVLSTVHVLMDLPQIQPSAIQHCHRLGTSSNNRPRPILVRFNDMSTKQMIWSNKKKLKSTSNGH
ncbi:unnamed protein product [Euphydryas editha]|uniref:Uncharacterized protein n=1 Tax=Euphydryas editha TaxID=104508 RepID=A0AAU9U1Z3_EUPED|nr:unnamed protein product [Euphydryas editha]